MIGTKIKIREYAVYRLIIRNKDSQGDGLIVGRMEVAAQDRATAQEAGNQWCRDRGLEPDWNCRVSVIRKMNGDQWVTTLVAQ